MALSDEIKERLWIGLYIGNRLFSLTKLKIYYILSGRSLLFIVHKLAFMRIHVERTMVHCQGIA